MLTALGTCAHCSGYLCRLLWVPVLAALGACARCAGYLCTLLCSRRRDGESGVKEKQQHGELCTFQAAAVHSQAATAVVPTPVPSPVPAPLPSCEGLWRAGTLENNVGAKSSLITESECQGKEF